MLGAHHFVINDNLVEYLKSHYYLHEAQAGILSAMTPKAYSFMKIYYSRSMNFKL